MGTVLLLVSLLGSCAVESTGTLGADRSLTLSTTVNLSPAFSSYLMDLQAALGQRSTAMVDIPSFQARLKEVPVIQAGEIRADRSTARVDLRVPDLQALAANPRFAGLVEYQARGTGALVRIRMGRGLIQAALAYLSPGERDNLAFLLPPANQNDAGAREAYEKQLAWALGDYASSTELKAMFAASQFRLTLDLLRKPTLVRGMESQGERQVLYRASVLDMLAGQRDELIEISW